MANKTGVYAFMCDFYEQHGYPATVNDIAEACALAPGTVRKHLNRLVNVNLVEKYGRRRYSRYKPTGYQVVRVE